MLATGDDSDLIDVRQLGSSQDAADDGPRGDGPKRGLSEIEWDLD